MGLRGGFDFNGEKGLLGLPQLSAEAGSSTETVGPGITRHSGTASTGRHRLDSRRSGMGDRADLADHRRARQFRSGHLQAPDRGFTRWPPLAQRCSRWAPRWHSAAPAGTPLPQRRAGPAAPAPPRGPPQSGPQHGQAGTGAGNVKYPW